MLAPIQAAAQGAAQATPQDSQGCMQAVGNFATNVANTAQDGAKWVGRQVTAGYVAFKDLVQKVLDYITPHFQALFKFASENPGITVAAALAVVGMTLGSVAVYNRVMRPTPAQQQQPAAAAPATV